MHQKSGQMGWADNAVAGKGRNDSLDRIDGLIDWSEISALVQPIYSSPKGRPSYPPLVMVKVLLLAQWYVLSDPQLEEALSDRLSFRRFVGLSLEEDTPDHSTISRFRKQLGKKGVARKIFNEVNRQLEARKLILKQGTLLDATLVSAQAKKPGARAPGKPEPKSADPDANWTRQYGSYKFGYKAHLGVDQESGLIRRAELTPAKVYESEVADRLICGDERAVYADRAYEQKERRMRLKSQGIKDRILHRSHKHQAELPKWQKRRNALIAPIRTKVERLFGTLKRSYGYTKVRYYNLEANTTQLLLVATAMNLRRAVKLAG